MNEELEKVKEERDRAVEEVEKLDEALAAVQNGPNVELMQAWDTERRELLQDLEAAENRVLGMQSQVREVTWRQPGVRRHPCTHMRYAGVVALPSCAFFGRVPVPVLEHAPDFYHPDFYHSTILPSRFLPSNLLIYVVSVVCNHALVGRWP